MPTNLKPNIAIEYAKHFTSLAIENKMIHVGKDESATAENIATFFNSLYEHLVIEENLNSDI